MVKQHWPKSASILLLVLFGLNACSFISVSDRVAYEDREGPIPESLLDDIQKDTSKHWLVSQFGEPLRVDFGPSGQEIYTYQFTRSHKRYADLILILRYRGVERSTEYLHVLMHNNLVAKHWIDRHEYVQAEGVWQGVEKPELSIDEDTPEKSNTIPSNTKKTPGIAI